MHGSRMVVSTSFHLPRRARGQVLATVRGDHHRVLHPQVEPLLRDAHLRIHRKHDARLQRAPAVVADVMHRHPHRMGQVVWELKRAPRGALVNGVGERRAVQVRGHRLCRLAVNHVVGAAGPDARQQRLVVGAHEAVQGTLGVAVGAVHRPYAGDVGGVVVVVGRAVDQQQIAVGQRRVIGVVVPVPGVGAAGDDRMIGGAARAADPIVVLQHAGELILHHSRRRGAHTGGQRVRADRARLAQHRHFLLILDQPHLVEHR